MSVHELNHELNQSQKFRIIQFVASLLICWFACNLSADTPQIRLSVKVEGDDDVQMVSALSREFRKLDGVSLTDTQPTLTIRCVVYQIHGVAQQSRGGSLKGYAASVAIIAPDGLITHSVHTGPSVDAIAHDIAITLDGSIIEQMRRAAQPSSSP